MSADMPMGRPTVARERGAALLLALVVVTVVSTLAAGMVWQQWRSVQVEEAERARVQGQWVLQGATDWARLILREDARGSQIDHLGEPWAVPLQEARLSTFLAAGREVDEDSPALAAFLSGEIVDAQSRMNLRNLAVDGPAGAAAAQSLQRIGQAAGVPASSIQLILEGVRRSWTAARQEHRAGPQAALVAPQRLSELTWWGLDATTLEQLRPWVVVLPRPTPLNLNTASAELIAAVLEGADLAGAQRLVAARSRTPLRNIEQGLATLQVRAEAAAASSVSVQSTFFEIQGRLRLGGRVFQERVMVERRQLDIVVLAREREEFQTPTARVSASQFPTCPGCGPQTLIASR